MALGMLANLSVEGVFFYHPELKIKYDKFCKRFNLEKGRVMVVTNHFSNHSHVGSKIGELRCNDLVTSYYVLIKPVEL